MSFVSMVLATCSALAATGSSPEFRLDLRGLGPWQRHTARASEPLAFSSSWATNAAAGAKAVVKVMPVLKTKPKYLVIDVSGGTSATHYPISCLDEVPGGSWSDEYKTSKLVLRHIPAGSFIMGGRATDYPGAVNTNLHMVTITRDFYMGVFEVTQRQWELVMGNRPSCFTNVSCYAKRPVEYVSYCDVRGSDDAWPGSKDVGMQGFMASIQRKVRAGGFDLPTEAQWEYACRAGTTTALNTGKNLSDPIACAEMDEVGRYWGNSGAMDDWTVPPYANLDASKGTAVVGSYLPNSWGLYDMHGNVYEMCLDKYAIELRGSTDPVGADYGDRIVIRGSSWHHRSGNARAHKHEGWGVSNRIYTVGFRLCLQGGDAPDFAAASTLVNESETGSQSWTPTRSGTYYLTHSTMNGTTNVQLQSAWFEVPGCELKLEPQGELTNGVSVAITGAGEGWTVYYTTNGLAPSQASEKYTGPFSLPESATVRAVAYNTQGVASEETMATFTLHDALSVVGAVARQRYPWNGMVDVDCEIKGDPEAKYDVELVVTDLEGGTNLTVRTVYVDATSSSRQDKDVSNSIRRDEDVASTLAPGRHRLTWNADADIAYDHDFPRVAVTVKATKQSVLAGYARQFAISTDGYAGSETLTGVPVLVRLSTAIDGFDYRDFASPSNGADLAFFDANEQTLPYEIDEWHTNGESLVWVKLPTLAKGARFTCAYGAHVDATSSSRQNKEGSSSNRRDGDVASTKMKHEVWREYAGVWHMNEDSGTAFDSTEHGLDGVPEVGENGNGTEMIACNAGFPGKSRINAKSSVQYGNGLLVPNYDALALGAQFVVSGYFKREITPDEPTRLITRKHLWDAPNGWEIDWQGGIVFRGSSNVYFGFTYLQPCVYLTCVCNGANVRMYTNGVFAVAGDVAAPTDNGNCLMFGRVKGVYDTRSFAGQYDEIRLRGGSLSTDRIKADYDMIANRAFCTYGAVKKGAVE